MASSASLSRRTTSTSATTNHGPFASLISRQNNSTRSPTRQPQAPRVDDSGRGREDVSPDPISSASPSPPPQPSSQVGLSVVVPDYLPTQFVLDNIEHFKSSDHLTPNKQQGLTCGWRTSLKQHPSPLSIASTRPQPQRPSLARTHSDIIPADVSTQLALQDITRYRSSEHFRPSDYGDTSKLHRPAAQEGASTSSSPRTPTSLIPTTTTTAALNAQDQPSRRRSAGFSPFKPLFPPPPPVTETKSPKRKGTPKKATPKKRRLEISMVDDTDPIEDADSDDDWQVFWSTPTKGTNEGINEKRLKAVASPTSTPTKSNRPVLSNTTIRPTLKPPEPLGPKLLQISREELHKGHHSNKGTLTSTPIQKRQTPPVVLSLRRLQPNLLPALPTIPLDPHVVSFVQRLTPIKDLTTNNPQRLYNIMGLIQLIAPVQDGVSGYGGKVTAKAGLTVCDKGSIHLNVTLWGDKCKWVELCNVGDVVLLSNIGLKEYRQKMTASTRSSSGIFRMDGTLLDQYRGSTVVEDHLRELSKMRETLGHGLMDTDRGYARDPSFYQTLNASFFLEQGVLQPATPKGSDFDAAVDDNEVQEKRPMNLRDEVVVKIEHEDSTKPFIKVEPIVKVKIEPGTESSAGSKAVGKLQVVPCPTKWNTIRGIVVYHKLNVDGDESRGWEIGAVTMTTKKFFKIQTSTYTPWIEKAKPQRLIQFVGVWSKTEGMLRIGDSAREPDVLKEKGPDLDRSSMKILSFASVKKVIESRYMGVALVEGYIDGVTFPLDIMDQFWEDQSVFSIPHIVCSNCNIPMTPLEEDQSKFICVECQSDSKRHATSQGKWCYYPFQFRLGDKPSFGSNQQSDVIRVSCKGDVGQQVFPGIPATEWSESMDKYMECRQQWITWMGVLNGQTTEGSKSDVDILNNQEATLSARHRRVRIEVGVGKGRMGQAVRVKYLHHTSG
ncbi:hypothetical protein BGW39_002832 [Mortierella sp. 14UC]|nr:hypothetical protein BGW39_002832 [Mortierella sp. 14UC]